MARPKNPDPSISLNTSLPKSLKDAVDEKLMDRTTGRIPVGAYQRLIVQAFKNYLACFKRGNK